MTEPSEKQNIVFGLRPVIEAINGNKEIEKIFIQDNLKGDLIGELMKLIHKHRITHVKVPVQRIERFTRQNHQGVVALMSPVEYQDIREVIARVKAAGEVPFVLVLDGITDVRNFGAIARTAECAGVHALVLPEKGSVKITADAIKTSAGALFRVPVCRSANLYYVLAGLKGEGFIIAAVSEKGGEDYRKVDYKGPAALILGAEDRGISPQLLKLADAHVSIPVLGAIGSLNVSVAAGIMVYEVVRHRS